LQYYYSVLQKCKIRKVEYKSDTAKRLENIKSVNYKYVVYMCKYVQIGECIVANRDINRDKCVQNMSLNAYFTRAVISIRAHTSYPLRYQINLAN